MIERTTVRLPADLLARAKRRATAEGRTLTSLIEDGLRQVLAKDGRATKVKRKLPRISKAGGGLMPGIDLSSLATLQESEDIDYLKRIQRQK